MRTYFTKKTEFSINPMCISAIRSLVIAKYNIFISGGTESGKTTFFVLNVKTVMFFLCTAEHYSIINPVLLHKFKGYNKENGKPDESLGRKARRG